MSRSVGTKWVVPKPLFTLSAGYLAVVGLALMLVPLQFGRGAVPADAAPELIALLRLLGGPFLGIAVLNWLSRDADLNQSGRSCWRIWSVSARSPRTMCGAWQAARLGRSRSFFSSSMFFSPRPSALLLCAGGPRPEQLRARSRRQTPARIVTAKETFS